uniref:Uncharacterized protein n=1 Tax=Setaria viridis TaxID=4556 RepID=A0A4U6V8V5_SETVI|nr:hypothetical protein SEVIR_3G073250v2 [Setaria viridis]
MPPSTPTHQARRHSLHLSYPLPLPVSSSSLQAFLRPKSWLCPCSSTIVRPKSTLPLAPPSSLIPNRRADPHQHGARQSRVHSRCGERWVAAAGA